MNNSKNDEFLAELNNLLDGLSSSNIAQNDAQKTMLDDILRNSLLNNQGTVN